MDEKGMYDIFASYYDKLMKDIDYDNWVNFIIKNINENNIKSNDILELCCGTGNITIPLCKKGYNVYGVDISEKMLTIAKDKALENDLDIEFINQDVLEYNTNKKYSIILTCCDGINYIEEGKVETLFKKIYNILDFGGVFIFDISTLYKLKDVLHDKTYGEVSNKFSYIWQNYHDNSSNVTEMYLTFFIKNAKGSYDKYDETHFLKAYDSDYLKSLLFKVGFKNVDIFGENFTRVKNDQDLRNFFVVKK